LPIVSGVPAESMHEGFAAGNTSGARDRQRKGRRRHWLGGEQENRRTRYTRCLCLGTDDREQVAATLVKFEARRQLFRGLQMNCRKAPMARGWYFACPSM
jgi:hypothetical protein